MAALPFQFLSTGRLVVSSGWYIAGITIPAGFVFDGATIPRICWTLLGYHPTHFRVIRAAALHDYLISTNAPGRYRDNKFRYQLITDGVPKWKANLMAWGVRKYRQLKDRV